MKPENSIEVHDVKKTFKVYMDKGHTMKELALFSKRRRHENRSVLKGISFDVKKGEAIGLIGHNGCGKSTTLKLLTRIMYPDSGTIEMRGRVSSLIELGAGFHPDMSGRENIYINASIFGLTKKEIDAKVDDIIRFSELEEFIDNPVRTYSSGMYMRLAFAVAINVNAEILLIDEILAVGDANFQEKCFNKMREIKGQGTTIVLVSHSLGQITQICDRAIWLNDGNIILDGDPEEVSHEYLEFMNSARKIRSRKELEEVRAERKLEQAKEAAKKAKEAEDKAREKAEYEAWLKKRRDQRYGNGKARFTNVEFYNEAGEDARVFDAEEPCTLHLSYEVNERVRDTVFGYGLFRSDGEQVHGTNTHLDRLKKFEIRKDGSYDIQFDRLGLVPGKYWMDVTIETWEGIPVDYWKKAIEFEVVSAIKDIGVARVAHKWEIDPEEFLKPGEELTPLSDEFEVK